MCCLRKKVQEYITDDTEICSDGEKNSDEENSDGENSNEENLSIGCV